MRVTRSRIGFPKLLNCRRRRRRTPESREGSGGAIAVEGSKEELAGAKQQRRGRHDRRLSPRALSLMRDSPEASICRPSYRGCTGCRRSRDGVFSRRQLMKQPGLGIGFERPYSSNQKEAGQHKRRQHPLSSCECERQTCSSLSVPARSSAIHSFYPRDSRRLWTPRQTWVTIKAI
jgi:hypothetical protein